jgi:hypothetical protein
MFFQPFGSGGSGTKLICFHHGTYLFRPMVKSKVENVMEANTSGLVMVDFFFATVRNLLGDSGF